MIYPLNIENDNDIKRVCEKIGTDTRALAYLVPKSRMLHFYAENIDYRAAGFLKQELLARGGDVIVTKHVIDGKTETSDILLMATASQLRSLREKLKAMDIWGIKEFREELSRVLHNINLHEWEIVSPNGHKLTLNNQTKLMAIINLTPDSFYAGSRVNEGKILSKAEKFLSEGAAVLDIGAESTRPGSSKITADEELERLLPGLRLLRREFPEAIISVDTYKPEVARISANEGADIINDISGFEFSQEMPEVAKISYDEGADISGVIFSQEMPEVISELNIPYVLSHFKTDDEPLGNIHEYFAAKLEALKLAGVKQVIIDPGLGFGKNVDENFALIKNIESLKVFGLPILVGHSRKRLTGPENFAGTLAVTALLSGRVSLLRVHDVKENLQALRIAEEITNGGL